MKIFLKIIMGIALLIIILVGLVYIDQVVAKTHYTDFLNVQIDKLCCIKDETADWKTYTNEKYGFEFKYPENYKISSTRGGEVGMALESEYAFIDFVDSQESDSAKVKSSTINGMEVLEYNGGNMSGGIDYEVLFKSSNTKSGYLGIVFSTHGDGYESKISEFKKIASTFKLIGKTVINNSLQIQKELICPDEKSSLSGVQWDTNTGKIKFNCVIDDERMLILTTNQKDSANPSATYSMLLTKETEGNTLQQFKVGTVPVHDSKKEVIHYNIKVSGDDVDISYVLDPASLKAKGWKVNTKTGSISSY